MRAYVGLIGHSGLQSFIAEDAVPRGLLQELVSEWSSPTATVVEAVIDEEHAEVIRRELAADHQDLACNSRPPRPRLQSAPGSRPRAHHSPGSRADAVIQS